MDKREFLKSLGLLGVGATILGAEAKASTVEKALDVLGAAPVVPDTSGKPQPVKVDIRGLEANIDKPLTCIIIGAGGRGTTYARYAEMYPSKLKVIGVSDLLPYRQKRLADKHGIKPEMVFGDFHEVFTSKKKLADFVVISTPDDLHYEPCMTALSLGYDVLLEKPIAQTEKECKDIAALAKKNDRIVAVCHVLRYAPYFVALKSVIDSGAIGELVSIQHMEPIQYAHMSHSYVRGNWRSSKETTPIILAKSCHDLDIIRWMVGKPCKTISADGSLTFFRKENAPAGSTSHCTECPLEAECQYSAVDIYVRKREHLHVFDIPNNNPETIMDCLLHTEKGRQYSRCVFRCDNDQPDHYVCNMVFEGGATASFNMEAFSPTGGRRTRVMGTRGYIDGDGKVFTVTEFGTNKKMVWDVDVNEIDAYKGSGHGGGDLALERDFLEAVAAHDEKLLTSNVQVSVESHVMGFRAEKSRLSMKKVKVD